MRNPVVVSPDLSLGRFMGEVAWGRPFPVYPVVEDGRALGLVSVNSVMEVPRVEWADRRVRDRMLPSERVPILAPEEELIDALQEFGGEVQFGLVVDGDGRLVGVLSGSDAARALELAAVADACEGRSRSRPSRWRRACRAPPRRSVRASSGPTPATCASSPAVLGRRTAISASVVSWKTT